MSVQLQAGGSLRIPMSYADYLALGETRHHEHYDGLTIVNPPNRRHVLVAYRLGRLLGDACPAGYQVLPEWGWQPVSEAVFEPDVMVAAADAPGDDLLRAAPLLVIEISSPSTRSEDLGRKMHAYADGGAPWYWIVDPDAQSVTVHGLDPDTGRFGQHMRRSAPDLLLLRDPFPMSINLAALFA